MREATEELGSRPSQPLQALCRPNRHHIEGKCPLKGLKSLTQKLSGPTNRWQIQMLPWVQSGSAQDVVLTYSI